MRFHIHMIMGYSRHNIQAAMLFSAFATRLLHLPRGFYIYCAAFAFAAWLLHLPHGFCIYRVAFAFTARPLHFAARLLHFAARLLDAGAGDPSRPP